MWSQARRARPAYPYPWKKVTSVAYELAYESCKVAYVFECTVIRFGWYFSCIFGSWAFRRRTVVREIDGR